MSLTSTALVAEDNDFVRMQMVKFLKDAGYQVKEATDGTGAIDSVAEKDVDIAIVDVRMQPVDGFGFIKTIRGKNIDIPVILVTGDNNPDLLEQAQLWHVGAVLIKPVQKDRLLKTVERTLAAYRKRAS